MGISTTRSITDLRQECDKNSITWTASDSKEQLVNRLREKLSGSQPVLHDPMKCKDLKKDIAWGTDAPFAGIGLYLTDKYVAEPKYDGCRMTLVLGRQGNRIYSGRRSVKTYAASDRTDNFPHLRDAAMFGPGNGETVIDGELLAPSAKIQTHTGNWTDSLLNASVALCNSKPAASAATQAKFGKARFVAFDVTSVLGEDVTKLTYDQRRALLEQVVTGLQQVHQDCNIELAPQWEATAAVALKAIADGYEGVVLKNRTSTYKAGSRNGGWYKVKTMSTADGFVTGWTPGESGNTGLVGSLELSVIGPELDGVEAEQVNSYTPLKGGKVYSVVPVAQVGNLTEVMRKAITAPDGSLEKGFYGTVVEFMGQAVSKNGKVRHPHMLRLRPDKTCFDCQPDQLDVFPRA